ncbi:MAG: hypothetical protein V1244_06900, partial [Nitrospinaceae bacterium]|nr:hypothetical protein [Nitrospinaceae bacterium]
MVRFFTRVIQPINSFHISAIICGSVFLCVANASAIPLDDAYEKGQAEVRASPEFNPKNGTPPVFHPSLHPNLNNEINEAHPIPDYIKKFGKNQIFPVYYHQLLKVDPKDQVQSKIFNEQAFRSIRRIGVLGFENKTEGQFKDENAGNVVAKQVSRELQSVKNYFVIPPPRMDTDAQLRIVKQSNGHQEKASSTEVQPTNLDLPYSSDKMDAVMIGAVTKYMDSYRTRSGTVEKSLSGSVEFGAFLVSTRTGDVIWGARFVGSQPTGLSRLFLNTGPTWLSKEQLSQA